MSDPSDQDEVQTASLEQDADSTDSDNFDVDIAERWAKGKDKRDSEDATGVNPDLFRTTRQVDSATGLDDPDPVSGGREGESGFRRKPRVATKELGIQVDGDGNSTADWSSWDIKKSLQYLKPDSTPLLRRRILMRLHKRLYHASAGAMWKLIKQGVNHDGLRKRR